MGLRALIRSLRTSTPAHVERRIADVDRRVRAHSEAEARRAVLALIAAGDRFHVEPLAPGDVPRDVLRDAPPAVQELFATHRRIALGGMELRTELVEAWRRDAAFHCIGTDLDHADVVVRRDDGSLAIVEDDGAASPAFDDVHASVWHYLLTVEALAHPSH
jgi:hypothetical protein